ncbi:Aste57867_10568 [Aphanomyces stellatus]|uniref:Aste57867_10568 protein n=1 Tax=Aphanomyces stellatus TaxID=120398 RepID=A0A485KRA3_9STRA|nr:hypothetical protein As57867_010528 [Aphanomyces stellatus]VFT87441.1 Aste57867_10568 [Aphanomyces stellatus]
MPSGHRIQLATPIRRAADALAPTSLPPPWPSPPPPPPTPRLPPTTTFFLPTSTLKLVPPASPSTRSKTSLPLTTIALPSPTPPLSPPHLRNATTSPPPGEPQSADAKFLTILLVLAILVAICAVVLWLLHVLLKRSDRRDDELMRYDLSYTRGLESMRASPSPSTPRPSHPVAWRSDPVAAPRQPPLPPAAKGPRRLDPPTTTGPALLCPLCNSAVDVADTSTASIRSRVTRMCGMPPSYVTAYGQVLRRLVELRGLRPSHVVDVEGRMSTASRLSATALTTRCMTPPPTLLCDGCCAVMDDVDTTPSLKARAAKTWRIPRDVELAKDQTINELKFFKQQMCDTLDSWRASSVSLQRRLSFSSVTSDNV